MAETVGQHSVATFTSPVNGSTPIDANTVRGNDNTIRVAYVDHDADPGIHVQSSALASRPVAGAAGRKWLTTDAGAIKLFFDTGSAWSEISYLPLAGGTVAGNVSITGTLGVTNAITATGGVVGNLTGNVTGNVTGNASTATALATARTINGVSFDGTANITVTADAGTLTGSTLASGVTASSLTSVGTLANLTVTNPITGSVTGSSGSTTGNAATATALQTARTINGTSFNGTANITVTAAAGTLTGTALNSTVTGSSLTSVGTLTAGAIGTGFTAIPNTALANSSVTVNGTAIALGASGTVAAAAGTLTGSTLASGVTASSLTSVGTLSSLAVSGATVVGQEVSRASTADIMRVAGGTAADGATVLLSGSTNVSAPGRLQLEAVGVGNMIFRTGGTERARIDASGNLGVGVTPTYRLDALAGAGAGNVFRAGQLSVSNGYTITTSGTALTHRWANAGTDAMTLDANGNLGVGTASPNNRISLIASNASGLNLAYDAVGNARTGLFLFTRGSSIAGISGGGEWNDTNATARSAASSAMLHSAGETIWYGNTGLTAGNTFTPTERARLDASGNLAVDTNTLFVDAVNNRVGVGTASPGQALDVFGADGVRARVVATSGGTPGLILSSAGATAYTIKAGNGDSSFRIDQDGTDRITLASGGNVGIGTTSPSAIWGRTVQLGNGTGNGTYSIVGASASGFVAVAGSAFQVIGRGGTPLQLGSNDVAQATLDTSGNLGLGVTPSAWNTYRALDVAGGGAFIAANNAAEMWSNAFFDGTVKYKATAAATRYNQANGAHAWYTAPSGTAGNAISFTQAMTLDASGNLLVGLTSTIGAAKAAVAGTILSSTNTLSTFSGAYGGFDWVSRSTRIFAGSADATNSQIEFYAGVSGAINERFRIKGPGQVRFIPLAAAPTTNVEDGDVYYDSTTNKLRVRAGGAWVDLH